jgi:hypothetical protein
LITDLSQLVGFCLEACRFSRGSYDLEFDGKLNERRESLRIGTSYSLSTGTSPRNDLCENVSQEIWPFLEQVVTEVLVNESAEVAEVIVRFTTGELVFWQQRPAGDNLLVVNDRSSPEWCVFL